MKPFSRVLMDVTYARTQIGNVGITRAVRRLQQELDPGIGAFPIGCISVAFHSKGFRIADAATTAKPTASGNSTPARLLRYFMSGSVRTFISSYLPRWLLAFGWRIHSAWAFDALSSAELPVRFVPGDVLVIGDQSWNYQSWKAARLARAQGAKVILLVYDLIPVRHPEFCNWLFTRVFENWLEKMSGCTDAVACISKATHDDLLQYFNERRYAGPAVVHFRLGCDLEAFGDYGAVRAGLQHFAEGDGACFVAVGSVEPRKNYALLIDAFELLWAAGLDVRLVVAGRVNPESAALARRMQEHKEQGGRLLWLQDASDAEVAWMYSTFRALVFPSLAEGFGLPLVEARVLGCPVIASDLKVFEEISDSGVWLFPRHSPSALSALVAQHAVADHRPQAGFQPAFTWKDSAAQLLNAVNIVLDPQPQPPPHEAQGDFACNPSNPSPNF
jgi:glycosyltransferase involved in cell wall biosynthesis